MTDEQNRGWYDSRPRIGTGMKRMKKSNSRSRSGRASKQAVSGSVIRASARRTPQQFAVCVSNDGYPASLELRKLYPVLEDSFADEHNLTRVIDESGDDYLYPARFFIWVDLPAALRQRLRKIA